MPEFRGAPICDWVDPIAALKRADRLPEALELAQGCMDAMVATALHSPSSVMEHYVIEVARIQHKMKDYAGEERTIAAWLELGLSAPREDYRLDLRKRLAKARELRAREEGRDPSAHRAEWKRLVEQSKTAQVSRPSSAAATGRSQSQPGTTYRRRGTTSPWVPTVVDFLAETFVAADFETANRAGGASACQLAMVKVSRGRIVERFATLLRPPPGLDYFEFTYLHGISAVDVRTAPMWDQVAPRAADFAAGVPVYAHNAPFDAKVWSDLDGHFATRTRPSSFYCSYRTAKRVVPGLENYKLPTVAGRLIPDFQLDHHRAGSDAEACGLIVGALQTQPGAAGRLARETNLHHSD